MKHFLLAAVEPTGHRDTGAFVSRADGVGGPSCSLETLRMPVYPPSPKGADLQLEREELELRLGRAARLLGIAPSDLSALELGRKTPADADVLRAPVVPAQNGSNVRHWGHDGQPAAPPDTDGLVPVPRAKAETANGESLENVAPDAVLRRVLMYIEAAPGANLSSIREGVHGKLEHISEALRTAMHAVHIADRGDKRRRAYDLTETGKAFLRAAAATPLPAKHGHKTETLFALLCERGALSPDDAAEAVYGVKDRWTVSRSRNLLHQLRYQGKAVKGVKRGTFEPAQAAIQ